MHYRYHSGRSDGRVFPRRSRPLSEESPEEQEVRRRRREAMVLNEGDRPISQDDIIEAPHREWLQNHTPTQNGLDAGLPSTPERTSRTRRNTRSASDPNIHSMSPLNNENAPNDEAMRAHYSNTVSMLREMRNARRAMLETEGRGDEIDSRALRDITNQMDAMERQLDRLVSGWGSIPDINTD